MIRKFISEHTIAVSVISYVEVLGYHKLTPEEKTLLEAFFSKVELLEISPAIRDQAVQLRQAQRISLGDALIAATALVHDLSLVTRNVDDYKWISDLTIINPYEE